MTKEEQQRAIRELAAERRELIAEQSGVQPRLDLETLRLDHGAHPSFEAGHCLMEAVAFFAGEPHSDAPKCVSPYLRAFGIRLNDRATAERRQDLVRFVPLVVGTAGDGLDEVRRWMAADHVARVSLPRHLDSARFFAAFALSAGAALVVTGVAALLLGASIWSMLAVALVAAAFVSAAVTR